MSKKRQAKPKEFTELVHAIDRKQIPEAISQYESLVSSVAMNRSPVSIDRRTIGRFVMQLRYSKQKSHLNVLKRVVEEDMPKKLYLKPSHYEYHALMYAYGVQKKPLSTVYAVIERMKEQQGLEPNVYTYNTLLRCCKQSNNLRMAQRYFEEMLEKGIKPDRVTYNTMLHLLSKLEQFEEMFRLYTTMANIADGYTYSIMLDAAVKARNVSIGLEIYRNLLTSTENVKIDMNTYNNMIRFAAAEMDVNEALDLYNRLQQQADEERYGVDFAPDVFTLNILLDACLKNNMLPKAYMIFRDMKERNVQPNVYTYGILLDACFKKGGNLASAIDLFEEMCSKGIKPSDRILNSLTNMASLGTAQLADLKHLLRVLERYKEQHKLDISAYNALLFGLALYGQSHTVHALYNQIRQEARLQPDIVTYTNLTLAYINDNDIDTALQIYYNLRTKHKKQLSSHATRSGMNKETNDTSNIPLRLDTIFYSTILSALSKKSHSSDTSATLNGDSTVQNSTSLTLTPVADIPASTSRLSAALDLFNDMRPLHIKPTIEIYTTMLHLCGQYRDHGALNQIHQHLKVDLTLDPDIGIYNALMDAYNRVGDGEAVLDIWQAIFLPEIMATNNSSTFPVSVDQTTVSIVLDSCGHNGFFQQAKWIWQLLKQRPDIVRLNTNNFNSFIECLCRSRGDAGWRMAYRVLKDEMKPPNATAVSSNKPTFDRKTINTLLSFARKKKLNSSEVEEVEKLKLSIFGDS